MDKNFKVEGTMNALVINNTHLSLEQIEQLPLVGRTSNLWRCRTILLYQNADRIISVGRTFDNKYIIICDEGREEHAHSLNAFPETYIYR